MRRHVVSEIAKARTILSEESREELFESDSDKSYHVEECGSIYAQVMAVELLVFTDRFHIDDRPPVDATFGEFYISYPGQAQFLSLCSSGMNACSLSSYKPQHSFYTIVPYLYYLQKREKNLYSISKFLKPRKESEVGSQNPRDQPPPPPPLLAHAKIAVQSCIRTTR